MFPVKPFRRRKCYRFAEHEFTSGEVQERQKRMIPIRRQVAQAVRAIESKKGEDIVILEMDMASGAFTDYFVLCTGTNPRQVQAISDEVKLKLGQAGTRPNNIEGYNQAEWVLLDYVDFVIHIFSAPARKVYDLERLRKAGGR